MTRKLLVMIWLGMALAGCNMAPSTDVPRGGLPRSTNDAPNPASGPRSWIDRPLEGSEYPLGRPIPIRWHATDPHGVQQVEIRVNGQVFLTSKEFDHTSQLVNQEIDWNPTAPGEYLIEVLSTGLDGSKGLLARNRVTVLGKGGVVAGAVYADLNQDGDADDAGEGPLGGVSVVVAECGQKLDVTTGADGAFRFEGVPAGDCVMDLSKPQWFFSGTFPAGIDFPIHFSPDPNSPISFTIFMSTDQATSTPVPSPTVTLISKTAVPPSVTPVTAIAPPVEPPTVTPPPPPPPPPDTQGPPAPSLVAPTEDAMLNCTANIVLKWSAPSDPSGIANYRVRLQKKEGASWVDAKVWDPVTAKQVTANSETECGNAYRWRLFARDKAGNQGQVSEWFHFGIALD